MNRVRIGAGLAIASALLLAGCGAPTFDATDAASADASLAKMQDGMTEEQKKELNGDMLKLAGPKIQELAKAVRKQREETLARGEKPDRSQLKPTDPSDLLKSSHGLTAAQIHAKAEELRKTK